MRNDIADATDGSNIFPSNKGPLCWKYSLNEVEGRMENFILICTHFPASLLLTGTTTSGLLFSGRILISIGGAVHSLLIFVFESNNSSSWTLSCDMRKTASCLNLKLTHRLVLFGDRWKFRLICNSVCSPALTEASKNTKNTNFTYLFNNF